MNSGELRLVLLLLAVLATPFVYLIRDGLTWENILPWIVIPAIVSGIAWLVVGVIWLCFRISAWFRKTGAPPSDPT